MGLLNPEMFLPIVSVNLFLFFLRYASDVKILCFCTDHVWVSLSQADTIEDVMQASLPSFIDAVKVSDIGQGDTPFRILAMRALPDKPGDPEYPRDEWINGQESKSKSEMDDVEAQKQEEQSGDYINYEVSFAYQAKPGKSDKSRSRNIQ